MLSDAKDSCSGNVFALFLYFFSTKRERGTQPKVIFSLDKCRVLLIDLSFDLIWSSHWEDHHEWREDYLLALVVGCESQMLSLGVVLFVIFLCRHSYGSSSFHLIHLHFPCWWWLAWVCQHHEGGDCMGCMTWCVLVSQNKNHFLHLNMYSLYRSLLLLWTPVICLHKNKILMMIVFLNKSADMSLMRRRNGHVYINYWILVGINSVPYFLTTGSCILFASPSCFARNDRLKSSILLEWSMQWTCCLYLFIERISLANPCPANKPALSTEILPKKRDDADHDAMSTLMP